MQINKNYEKEIDLRDLFFHLCYRWRSLIVAALVGAVLLGGFQYYSIYRIHSEGKQTKEEKQYVIDLQNYQDSVKNAKNSIRTYNKLMKEKNDYLDESVYMSLDSQNEWMAYKRYYIKLDQAVLDALPESVQEDPADYVAAVYVSTLKSGLNATEIEELLGTGRKEYIDELVNISADNATNTITVLVIGADEETVRKQLDYFINRLMEVSMPLAQQVGAHTLATVNEDCLTRMDNNLSAKQDEINQQLVDWQEALKEQREALNALEDKKEPKAPGMHLMRYSVTGIMLGVILLAGIYLVKYVLSDRLRAGRELTARFGLPVYGEFTKSRARRPGKGLDKLFEKWEFNHSITDPEVVNSGICALLAEQFGGKKVLLTGTVAETRLSALADGLRRKLDGTCEIVSKGGLPVDTDAIAEVKDADAVILVEEKRTSRMADVERAAEMLLIGKADVKGCIVL